MPNDFPLPILMVQHMPAAFTKAFATRLNSLCKISVKEAEDGDVLKAGCAYLAPGGKQMVLEGKESNARIKILEDDSERIAFKPSVDITFGSTSKIFSDNVFYDNINMGSLNFVLACFENYFLRPASTSETTNGEAMVDGESKIILLRNGNSKDDFIQIVTESDEFYEGLVIENYRSYLSRNPNTLESYQATLLFQNSGNLKEMQKIILKTDEYAGF